MGTEAAYVDSGMPSGIANAAIWLALIKAKKSPLIEYLQKGIKKDVGIDEVRRRLAGIAAPLAHEIVRARAERV